MRSNRVVWALLCAIVGLTVVAYLSLALASYDRALVLPLDDTYIHFQYARQMATGHPYAYNTGDAPTSGATSLLYTPLLAVGYWLGFRDLSLAHWAVLLGSMSLLASAWLIFLSVREAGGSHLVSGLVMLTFALNGAIIWSALSGMETLPFVFSVLLCLYAYQKGWERRAAGAGALAALMRPEGAIVAGTLALALMARHWRRFRRVPMWSLWPIAAIAVQPVLNLALTGTLSATGNLAKSELFDVTAPWPERANRVLDHWLRMWREFFGGHALYGDPYLPGAVFVLALLMLAWDVRRTRTERAVQPGVLAGVWMALLSLAAATLETAFWHYKRYQIPIMALAVPLAGWLLVSLRRDYRREWLFAGIAALILLASAGTNRVFLGLYQNNVLVTSHFQLQLAQWIDAHLPAEAKVGVFDVGVVRYVGQRDTYDTVGLTTPGVAGAMRQGPGTMYDTMASHPSRPGYFALYPVAAHPTTIYLMETSTWGRELARFEAPHVDNTTAAGSTQVVAAADWSDTTPAADSGEPYLRTYTSQARPLGMLNVGDLASERDFHYAWKNRSKIPGFLAILEQLPYTGCEEISCTVIDGARAINGRQSFRLPEIDSGEDYLIVMRVSARQAASLQYGCHRALGDLVIPEVPGRWVDVAFLVPGGETQLCIDTHAGTSFPARYWLYAGHFGSPVPSTSVSAEWDGISLLDYRFEQDAERLVVRLTWWVPAATLGRLDGDGQLFVHLYPQGQVDQPPTAQWDGYLQQSVPVNNLLPGEFQSEITLPLTDVPPGEYTLALGFYDRRSGQRYPVQAEMTDDEGQRLLLGTLRVR